MGRAKKAGLREPNEASYEYCASFKKLAADAPALFGAAVYVIQAETSGSIKVGVSDNLSRRISQIETDNPERMRVFWAVRLAKSEAFSVERTFHKLCKGKQMHIQGEWYRCKPRIARNVIEAIIEKLGFHSQPDMQFGVDRDGQTETETEAKVHQDRDSHTYPRTYGYGWRIV